MPVDTDARARTFLDGLSHTDKCGYVPWVEDAGKAETPEEAGTRSARVLRAVDSLWAGRTRH